MKETTLCYIEQDGKYLMLLRNKKQNDENEGKWIGIGGKLEFGESYDDCVKREVLEETGLVLTKFRPRGIINFKSNIWGEERMVLYTASEFTGTVVSDCDEGELKWIEKADVLSLELWEGDRLFLERLLETPKDFEESLTKRYNALGTTYAAEDFFYLNLIYSGDELVESFFGGSSFKEKVYDAVSQVPYACVATYGDIAAKIGNPRASRAVGNALHDNPYDGIIPCHRVVNRAGRLSKMFCFAGESEQRERLEAEGVKVKRDAEGCYVEF